jgi:phosphoribosylaminoimidazole-succinocarboxamide synthase
MSSDVLLETQLPFPLFKKGKVRDVYDLKDRLLIVSTDRISAFDVVLPNGIPHKGEALNRLSVYWFNQTRDIVPNHILDVVDPRIILVHRTAPIKIEFVVRGYLYGSAWENYKRRQPVSGVRLPAGLEKAEKLHEPILTPTTKAEVGHDVEMTSEEVATRIGRERAREIAEACLQLYQRVSRRAKTSGIVIADTKLEFGLHNEELMLIDELFTPDSSRFWPAENYEVGKDQFSFDKQFVRDYLQSLDWNREPPAPSLPDHVITETSKKYMEAYERLTGRKF